MNGGWLHAERSPKTTARIAGGLADFISPALSDYLAPYNMAPGILGEATLTVWLLAVGVNIRRLNEQARTAS